jgi:hypothetical protein
MREKSITVVMLEPGKVARTAVIGSSLETCRRRSAEHRGLLSFEEEVCIVCNDEAR